MRLKAYLSGLYDTCRSRRYSEIERLEIREIVPNRKARIEGRLRFWNGSLLEFIEVLEEHGLILAKMDYAYHYQDGDKNLVFRYDNAPHHPEVTTHPHHKHLRRVALQVETIEPSSAPQLWDVLREIDQILGADHS